MNMIKKMFHAVIITGIMILAFILIFFAFGSEKAFADTKTSKLLFFVSNEDDYNSVLDWKNENAEIIVN